MVKNLPASVGDAGSISESGRCPGEGNDSILQYSAWAIPWTEEPGGLHPWGCKRVEHDLATKQ